ncbi:MAG: methylthioribulose 1-phosphate dehydratase [Blastopirellula sp. JB062]
MENVSVGGAPLSSAHPALAGHEAELDALRETGAYFFQRGWSVGTSSNYSAVLRQNPLQLALTASGMDKGRLTRADFVRVDDQGRQVDDAGNATTDQPKSSAETLLHVVAAAQPGVGAILHTHSIWGTLLSDYYFDEGGFAIEGYEMLKGLAGVKTHEHSEWVPVFENTQDIPVLAEQVAARLADTSLPPIHGYLIRRHGLYTWGADVAEARRHIEIYEFLFETVVRRMLLCGQLRSDAATV